MKTNHPSVNFLDLDPEFCGYQSSRFVVLPLPYEGTVSYETGTSGGPAAIIQASTQVELFDEELHGEFFQAGVFTAKPVDCQSLSPEQTQEHLYCAGEKLVADDKFILALGGEHSVSVALIKAAAKRWPNFSVLHLDAHADLRDTYQQSKFSHACVLRRLWEMSLPTTSVGIRSYSLAESRLLDKPSHTMITAGQIAQARSDSSAQTHWIDQALASLSDTVYVTIDIDVFDPSQAPGTGTPEPGGLDWYEVTALLRRVAQTKQIVSADIVEVIPKVAGQVTEFLAARLAYKIIAYSQR
jgi:agmatinase